VRERSLPACLVERSRIVLLAADGTRDSDIATALNITPHKVARWRSRFLDLGLAGLEKDAARSRATSPQQRGEDPGGGYQDNARIAFPRDALKHAHGGCRSGVERSQRAPHLARAWPQTARSDCARESLPVAQTNSSPLLTSLPEEINESRCFSTTVRISSVTRAKPSKRHVDDAISSAPMP
jgi:hypothetical protein